MTDYASKVADFAEREEALRLFKAREEALAKLDAEFHRREQELLAWHDSECRKFSEVNPDPLAREDGSYNFILEDSDGGAERCVLSGAVLYDEDAVIVVGDAHALACLFVPTDVIETLKAQAEEEEELEEAA